MKNDEKLSDQQIRILKLVMEKGEVPYDEFAGHIDDLRELINRSLLRLKISMHAWGVEYFVVRAKKSD